MIRFQMDQVLQIKRCCLTTQLKSRQQIILYYVLLTVICTRAAKKVAASKSNCSITVQDLLHMIRFEMDQMLHNTKAANKLFSILYEG